jgi:signal transduction histidine kinase
MATPQAAAKGIGFAVGVLAEPASLVTDASKLRQVLLNLLSNAIKFTERGDVTLWAEVDAGAVRFLVRDTGVGIAPEHLERVVEEFWQVEHPTTRRATGTGLGLAVSRRLARLLGGDLTVQSERGVGSVFVLELPTTPPAGLDAPPA